MTGDTDVGKPKGNVIRVFNLAGSAIKKFLKGRSMKQADLADPNGFGPSAISKAISGHIPAASGLVRQIAAKLEKEPDEIIDSVDVNFGGGVFTEGMSFEVIADLIDSGTRPDATAEPPHSPAGPSDEVLLDLLNSGTKGKAKEATFPKVKNYQALDTGHPDDVAGLFGRQNQLNDLLERLARTEKRVTRVTGGPGVGKTSFVRAAADALKGAPRIEVTYVIELAKCKHRDTDSSLEIIGKLLCATGLSGTAGQLTESEGAFVNHLVATDDKEEAARRAGYSDVVSTIDSLMGRVDIRRAIAERRNQETRWTDDLNGSMLPPKPVDRIDAILSELINWHEASNRNFGRLVLVLDNIEHLEPPEGQYNEFASDDDESLQDIWTPVKQWLSGNPKLHVLCTSRKRTPSHSVQREQEVTLDELPVPTPIAHEDAPPIHEIKNSPAIRLFEHHIGRDGESLQLADWIDSWHICERLHGNPHLITLVAHAAKQFGRAGANCALRRTVRDDLRQQVLPGWLSKGIQKDDDYYVSLYWSFRLLSTDAQELLVRLSYLLGGFDEELACSVSTSGDHFRTVHVVQSAFSELKGMHFVFADGYRPESRYTMHESTREFAYRYAESHAGGSRRMPDDVFNRICAHYRPWESTNGQSGHEQDVEVTHRSVVADMQNVMAAVESALTRPYRNVATAAELLLSTIGPFTKAISLDARISFIKWTIECVRHNCEQNREIICQRLRLILAESYWSVPNYSAAFTQADNAATESVRAGQFELWLEATVEAARFLTQQDECSRAEAYLHRALDRLDAIQQGEATDANPLGYSAILMGLADNSDRRGDCKVAFQQATKVANLTTARDWKLYGRALNRLGLARWHDGEPKEAIDHLLRASEVFREHDDWGWHAGTQTNLGFALIDIGQLAEGKLALERAAREHRGVGNRNWDAVNHSAYGELYVWQSRKEDSQGRESLLKSAIERFQLSQEMTEKVNAGELAQSHMNLARGHYWLHDFPKAEYHAGKARLHHNTFGPDRRRFCSDVLLAASRTMLNMDVDPELIYEARKLAQAKNWTSQHPCQDLSHDVALLDEIASR